MTNQRDRICDENKPIGETLSGISNHEAKKKRIVVDRRTGSA